jgi:hypothetical protein
MGSNRPSSRTGTTPCSLTELTRAYCSALFHMSWQKFDVAWQKFVRPDMAKTRSDSATLPWFIFFAPASFSVDKKHIIPLGRPWHLLNVHPCQLKQFFAREPPICSHIGHISHHSISGEPKMTEPDQNLEPDCGRCKYALLSGWSRAHMSSTKSSKDLSVSARHRRTAPSFVPFTRTYRFVSH